MPRPQPPQPCAVQLPAGEYQWCACGESTAFPFCHQAAGCQPLRFVVKPARRVETLWLCGCGASKTKPFCDGSHNKLGPKTGWAKLA